MQAETELTAAEIATRQQEADAERIAGLRDRIRAGVVAMVKELSGQGMNPAMGIAVGSVMGIMGTMLDRATDAQADMMLVKMIEIMESWRRGEQPTS